MIVLLACGFQLLCRFIFFFHSFNFCFPRAKTRKYLRGKGGTLKLRKNKHIRQQWITARNYEQNVNKRHSVCVRARYSVTIGHNKCVTYIWKQMCEKQTNIKNEENRNEKCIFCCSYWYAYNGIDWQYIQTRHYTTKNITLKQTKKKEEKKIHVDRSVYVISVLNISHDRKRDIGHVTHNFYEKIEDTPLKNHHLLSKKRFRIDMCRPLQTINVWQGKN